MPSRRCCRRRTGAARLRGPARRSPARWPASSRACAAGAVGDAEELGLQRRQVVHDGLQLVAADGVLGGKNSMLIGQGIMVSVAALSEACRKDFIRVLNDVLVGPHAGECDPRSCRDDWSPATSSRADPGLAPRLRPACGSSASSRSLRLAPARRRLRRTRSVLLSSATHASAAAIGCSSMRRSSKACKEPAPERRAPRPQFAAGDVGDLVRQQGGRMRRNEPPVVRVACIGVGFVEQAMTMLESTTSGYALAIPRWARQRRNGQESAPQRVASAFSGCRGRTEPMSTPARQAGHRRVGFPACCVALRHQLLDGFQPVHPGIGPAAAPAIAGSTGDFDPAGAAQPRPPPAR